MQRLDPRAEVTRQHELRNCPQHSGEACLIKEIYADFGLMAGPEREAAEMLVPERRRQRFVPGVR